MNISSIDIELQKDEYWDKYYHWPTDYFPFNLPACVLTKEQVEIEEVERAMVTINMDYNLELELRLVDENKNVLHTYFPRNSKRETKFKETFELDLDQIKGKIGITFIWAFFIPCPSYGVKYPMGIIQYEASDLKGKNTIITISDTRKNRQ